MTFAIVLNLLPLLALFETPPVDCTFANPRYAGSCVEQVTPAASQTPVQACQVILACLNDTRCVKNYCRATTVRGGWSLVSPKAKKD